MEQITNINDEKATLDPVRLGSNQSGMRDYNERLVLSLIRRSGAMAKAQIARRTGLSAQTVSVIMRALEADGLLARGEPLRGKIGQPSVPMRLAKDGAFFFGLKIGRRSLDLVLTDFVGEVQHRERCNHPYPTPDNTLEFAAQAIRRIRARLRPEQRARIAGLGIALPFQLWQWATAPDPDMQGWKTRDIAAEIGAACDVPVFICNDASTACGAELVFGNQNNPRDFLHFFVGYFIGGGLVLDSSLYTGPTGNAAAVGSMILPSADGSSRQLVDVASLATLERTLAARGEESALIWDHPEDWHIPEAPLNIWLDNAAQGIAQAIIASVCLVDVGHVLIDGWMPTQMRAALVRRIQHQVAQISVAGVEKPEVRAGSIGSDARALGAASLPLSKRFLVENNAYQKGPAK